MPVQSAGERNLFLLPRIAPDTSGRFGHYQGLRKQMIKNPDKAFYIFGWHRQLKRVLPPHPVSAAGPLTQ